MTNAPQTDLDPSSARLQSGAGDWNDLGRRIRQAAAGATALVLLKSTLTTEVDDRRFTPGGGRPRRSVLPEN